MQYLETTSTIRAEFSGRGNTFYEIHLPKSTHIPSKCAGCPWSTSAPRRTQTPELGNPSHMFRDTGTSWQWLASPCHTIGSLQPWLLTPPVLPAWCHLSPNSSFPAALSSDQINKKTCMDIQGRKSLAGTSSKAHFPDIFVYNHKPDRDLFTFMDHPYTGSPSL